MVHIVVFEMLNLMSSVHIITAIILSRDKLNTGVGIGNNKGSADVALDGALTYYYVCIINYVCVYL